MVLVWKNKESNRKSKKKILIWIYPLLVLMFFTILMWPVDKVEEPEPVSKWGYYVDFCDNYVIVKDLQIRDQIHYVYERSFCNI